MCVIDGEKVTIDVAETIRDVKSNGEKKQKVVVRKLPDVNKIIDLSNADFKMDISGAINTLK